MKLNIKKNIDLPPKYQTKAINNHLLNEVVNMYEKKCIKEGLILPNSIEIQSRSIGTYTKNQFDGSMTYTVVFSAEVLNPIEGDQFTTEIKKITKFGILAQEEYLNINVVFEFSDKSAYEDKQFDIGDKVTVEVLGKSYNLGDDNIEIYCKLV